MNRLTAAQQPVSRSSLSTLHTLLRSPYLYMTGAALIMAGNFVVGRALRGEVAPVTLNFWRWTIALVLLLPLSWNDLRRERAAIRSGWKLIVALGATGIAAFQLLTYQALTLTTPINASLVLTTGPVAIALCAWIAFRETITRPQRWGLLASVVGAATVVAHGDLAALLALRLNGGDGLMLIAIVFMAIHALLFKRRPAGLGALALHTASVAAGVAVMLPLYAWQVLHGERLLFTLPNLLGVGYAATLSSVIAFVAWTRGNIALGPTRAGMFANLIPLFAAIQSVLLLHEPIAPYHLVGGLLVFGGIALANRR
jgi:drug/metabolite transporter (DMT)-like permease